MINKPELTQIGRSIVVEVKGPEGQPLGHTSKTFEDIAGCNECPLSQGFCGQYGVGASFPAAEMRRATCYGKVGLITPYQNQLGTQNRVPPGLPAISRYD